MYPTLPTLLSNDRSCQLGMGLSMVCNYFLPRVNKCNGKPLKSFTNNHQPKNFNGAKGVAARMFIAGARYIFEGTIQMEHILDIHAYPNILKKRNRPPTAS